MVETATLVERLRQSSGLSEPALRAVAGRLKAGRGTVPEILASAGLDSDQIQKVMGPRDTEEQDAVEDPDFTVVEGAENTVTTVGNEPSVDDLIARLVDITPRFELQGEIARGAMGRILAGWDLHLGRPVAIKILRKTSARDLDRVRFLEEAQVTGQLQHPNIMPVYELGRLRDQVAFVMRRVDGRSLKDVISRMRHGDREVIAQFGRMRLLAIFNQLCLAVAFAHTRGVVHRDLKPSNVMVGDFGEVLLLDWGLCKVIGQATRSTRSTSERWHTVHGQIIGTPAYMAPEQAMGLIDQVNARTDVYGLGAILYHLLTLRPPFTGKTNREIVNRVLKEHAKPPRDRAPAMDIPPAVEAIIMKCMARDASDRYEDARSLAAAVSDYIDSADPAGGKSRAGDVEGLVKMGLHAITRQQTLLEDAALVRDTLLTARQSYGPTDPAERKREAWDAHGRLEVLHREVAEAYAEGVNALQQAVALAPDHGQARGMLCDLYMQRLEQALSRGDRNKAAYYRCMLAEVHGGRFEAVVRGQGTLHVDVSPRGAIVTLWRLVERERRLVATDARDLGPAPVKLELPIGIYCLETKAADCELLTTTAVVNPGRTTRLRLRMLKAGIVPEGFVHVPAGTFRYGNPRDPFASPTDQALPDFLIGSRPVTAGEYLLFLNELGRSQPAAALRHAPRDHSGKEPAWDRTNKGLWRLRGAWTSETPVVGLSHSDVVTYCNWYTERLGRPVRLPTEEEWEKASRGPEGRAYPWGDGWEPGFTSGPEVWEGAWPPPVGSAPADVSAFGAWDFAGCVREWTSSFELGGGDPRAVVRGGSFRTGGDEGRPLWTRELVAAHRAASDLGFRLATDV